MMDWLLTVGLVAVVGWGLREGMRPVDRKDEALDAFDRERLEGTCYRMTEEEK